MIDEKTWAYIISIVALVFVASMTNVSLWIYWLVLMAFCIYYAVMRAIHD